MTKEEKKKRLEMAYKRADKALEALFWSVKTIKNEKSKKLCK